MPDTPMVEPSSLVIEAQPGVAASGAVTLNDPPADPGVVAAIAPGGDGFAVASIAVTATVWHRYTEDEIDELPEALRAAARKAGGFWQPQTTAGDGTSPIAIPVRAQQVTVSVTATVSSVGISQATLVLTGRVWGTIDIPVFAVVGDPTAVPVVSQNPLGLMALPGDSPTPSVTIQAPPPATVMATLLAGSGGIAIAQVNVLIPEHHPWTDDDLQDLPVQMREQAKKEGWVDWHVGPTGGPGTPLTVPPDSIVSVALAITVPTTDAPDEFTGTLVLLSTTWQTAEIPIRVVVSDFSAVPLTDRVAVPQGIPSDPFGVVLTSSIGPDTDVTISIADADAGDVTVDVPGAHLARSSTLTQPVRVSVAPNAVLGNYPIYLGESVDVGLRVTAFDGIFNQRFPLGLNILPGSVTVTALQGSIQGLQDSTATCQVSVVVSGGLGQLTFGGGALPSGVSLALPVQELNGPVTSTLSLPFTIAPDTPPGETMISVNWNAGDGANAGALSLPMTVQLRPDSQTFTGEVVTPTGTALGGRVSVTLDNSGNGTFSGGIRATGLPSYKFQVRAVIRSTDGLIAIAQQKSGEVFGTDTPGDREADWNEPINSAFMQSQWPEIRTASLAVSHAYELAGTLGTIEDLAIDLLEFLASSALIAATGGVGAVIFMGAELEVLTGVRPLGPAGFLGVIAAAGAVALLGPTVLIPALVAGAVITDVAVQYRRLRTDEISFASQVFGSTLPFDRIMLTNMTGFGNLEFTVPGVDGDILVNFGEGFDQPAQRVARSYTVPGQLFIHELTHAWQIANAGETTDYFWRAAMAKLAGHAAYEYGPPGPPWSKFGLEQQATIVDEWFAGTAHDATSTIRGRDADPLAGASVTDPYFGYIAGNIKMGLA